jgi:hypothetical protein
MSRENEDMGKLMRKVFGTHPNEAMHGYHYQSTYLEGRAFTLSTLSTSFLLILHEARPHAVIIRLICSPP